MLIQPAPTGVPQSALRVRAQGPSPCAMDGSALLVVDRIGCLVPRRDFSGRVHSTFARACNIEHGDSLLTLVAHEAGNGPALLRLAAGAAPDLHRLLDVGEPLRFHRGVAQAGRVRIDLTQARVWHAAPRCSRAGAPQAPRQQAQQWLDAHRRARGGSAIDGAAAATVAALLAACRARTGPLAAQHAARLVGWGEGLTPAGDDFLVGLCAGLDASIDDDAARAACRDAIAAALIASLPRTTRISAHYLRLAAAGHYNERVLAARDALLGDAGGLDGALHAVCAVGATSGADMLAGLLGALATWPCAERSDGAD